MFLRGVDPDIENIQTIWLKSEAIPTPVSEFSPLDPPRPKSLPLSCQRQTRNPGIPMPIPDALRTAAETHLDRYCVGLISQHAQNKVRIVYLAKGMIITLFSRGPIGRTRPSGSSPMSPGSGTQTALGRCITGTGTGNGTPTILFPYPGLRGGAAGDQGKPDGDMLGLKGC